MSNAWTRVLRRFWTTVLLGGVFFIGCSANLSIPGGTVDVSRDGVFVNLLGLTVDIDDDQVLVDLPFVEVNIGN